MATAHKDLSHAVGGPSGSLAALLETEARLDVVVAEAREKAAGRLAEAQAAAEASAAGLTEQIAAVRRTEDARLSAELAARRARLQATGLAAAAKFDQLTEADLREMAQWLVAELIDPSPERGR
jgi:hypothetical protein